MKTNINNTFVNLFNYMGKIVSVHEVTGWQFAEGQKVVFDGSEYTVRNVFLSLDEGICRVWAYSIDK